MDENQADGTACVYCGHDLVETDTPAVPVGEHYACRDCARKT